MVCGQKKTFLLKTKKVLDPVSLSSMIVERGERLEEVIETELPPSPHGNRTKTRRSPHSFDFEV